MQNQHVPFFERRVTLRHMNCSKFGKCGGCPLGGVPYEDQLRAKSAQVEDHLNVKAALHSVGQGALRDRIELIWQRSEDAQVAPILGLYALNHRELGSGRQLIDIDTCPMLTEPMEAWLKEYRSKVPPIALGTVRLRVAPGGQKGAWLDFANVDVKTLFEEVNYLKWLSDRAIVEIGQRRKRLVWKDEKPKLVDPVLFPWFETYGPNGQKIPLYGVIGGFTQVGFKSNKMLVEKVIAAAKGSGLSDWVELFCGSGNFGLALAASGFVVHGYENDALSVEALARSKMELALETLSIERLDIYHHPQKIMSLKGKGLLVDPPRSGLGKFLDWLESLPSDEKPKSLIYVSCFSDTFISDSQRLASLGFSLVTTEGVDQFPHSGHMEWVGRFVSDV